MQGQLDEAQDQLKVSQRATKAAEAEAEQQVAALNEKLAEAGKQASLGAGSSAADRAGFVSPYEWVQTRGR